MKTYYIYHIPGVKIGCSTDPNRRVKRQGYECFEILETHSDIETAAVREKELQKQYGYRVDKSDYVQHYEYGKAGRAKCLGMGAKSQIENKIGMFSWSKEKRTEFNRKNSMIGAKISAEKRSVPIDVYDYKTGKYLFSFSSKKEVAIKLNLSRGNITSVITGTRNHTGGYTFIERHDKKN